MKDEEKELEFIKKIANFNFSNDRFSLLNDVAKARLEEENKINSSINTDYLFSDDEEKLLSNIEKIRKINAYKTDCRYNLDRQDAVHTIPVNCIDRDNFIKQRKIKLKQKTNVQILLFVLLIIFVATVSS